MVSAAVLGDREQLGEFRPVGAAGEEGVDQRRGDDAEAVQALLFFEGLVVSGLLFGEVGIALLESGEEQGVFVAQSSVLSAEWRFVSKSRVLGSEGSIFLARALALALRGRTSRLASTAPRCGTAGPFVSTDAAL